MIAAWMIYSIAISLFVSVAAAAFDRVQVAMRRPTRFVWLAAMIATLAAPFIAAALPRTYRAPVPSVEIGAVTPLGFDRANAFVASATRAVMDISADNVLVALWCVLSALLLARIVVAVRLLEKRGRVWRTRWMQGVRIRMSRDMGPAVVGIDPMEIVLPSWAENLSDEDRHLVLLHEDEHRTAGDPYLLLFSTLLVAVMPWNLGLLWQARRLRLATEIDCDARVLRVAHDPDRYARLLLDVAARRHVSAGLLASALSEPALNLARRIRIMRNNRRLSATYLLGYGSVVWLAVAAACSVDRPVKPNDQKGSVVKEMPVTDTGLALGLDSAESIDSLRKVLAAFKELNAKLVEMQKASDAYRRLSRGVPGDSTLERQVQGTLTELRKIEGVQPAGTVSAPPRVIRADGPIVEQGTIGERPRIVSTDSAPPRVVSTAYYDFQVEKTATQIPGTGVPVYPEALKNAGIEGTVIASFVVNADGRAEMSTFRVIRSTQREFVDAVKTAVENARFNPAEVGGKAVKQLVQLPFAFNIR